jgi:hypothetical protein
MIRISIRIDEKLEARIAEFSEEHGIHNKQDAYRKLLSVGLSKETMFDKSKVVLLERQLLKDIKLIKNIVIRTAKIEKDEVKKLDEIISNDVDKSNILSEL